MSAQPERRHLTVVDTASGEVLPACPGCQERDDVIAGLEATVRSQGAKIIAIQRDKAAEARAHEAWPTAKAVFDYWRDRCKHPKSRWSADRFWLVQPFLEEDGQELCRRAIDGMAFDCFKVTRRNGSTRRFDEFERIFKDRKTFEEACNKAPRRDNGNA